MKSVARISIVLLFLVAPVWAADEVKPCGAPSANDGVKEPEQEGFSRNWYYGIGATNYHPKLRESEAQIDRELNGLFGWIPSWEEPTTFADWRDRCYLWDMTVGLGADITPKTTLMVWVGGATGAIKNEARYGPLRTDIKFSRTSAFIAPEFFYYPMGKVDYASVADKRGWDRVRAAVAGTKPYLALVTGYTFVRAKADVKFKAPLSGTFLRQRQSDNHDMYTISPRVGVELPVGKDTSIAPVFIYSFAGPEHGNEYDGPAFSFSVRHRF